MDDAVIQQRFTACMAAFLNGTPVREETAAWSVDEWKALYKMAWRQALTGALCAAFGADPIPEPAKLRLQRNAYQLMTRYEAQNRLTDELAAAFADAAVEHLFFKGTVLRQYYPQPAMRSMGDIDVLVRAEKAEAAHKAMLACGCHCDERSGEVWLYTRDDLLVEMHMAIRRYDVALQDTVAYDDPWQDAQTVRGTTRQWSDEQEAAHTVMHLAAHFCSGGCGMRQWMDVAVLCKRFEQASFWEAVGERLAPFGMREFLSTVLTMCGEWFDIAVPAPFVRALATDTKAALLDRILRDGTFGKDEQLMVAEARKELRRQKKSGKWARRWRRLFPEPSYMRRRYRYVSRHGVLLPFSYVHRWVQGVTKNRRTHRKRMQYAREQQQYLAQEAAFFETIGL